MGAPLPAHPRLLLLGSGTSEAPAVGGKVRKQPPHHERHSGDASGGGGPPLGDCPRPSDVDLGATMAVWRGREIRDAGSRQKRETSSLDKMEVQSEST